MNGQTIIVSTDFSTGSRAALEFAASIARDRKGRLIIAHVKETAGASDTGPLYPGEHLTDEELQRQLSVFTPDNLGVPITRLLLQGDPADMICDLAEKENAALIVMGTHGRRGIMRLLMGSVAELVVRRSTCPVLVVKQGSGTPQ
jgi:universal stress protein A